MQIRLCATFALMVIGGTLRPAPTGAAPGANRPTGFEPPEMILDGSEFNRRLFPTFADIDGNGTTDLLVGIPDRLLVYRNRGTDARPPYAEPAWLDETVPSARIPGG